MMNLKKKAGAMAFQSRKKTKQLGIVLKEIAIGLVVIASLAGMAIFGSNALFGGSNLVQTENHVGAIASAARIWKQSQGAADYTGVSMAAISATLQTAGTLSGAYGGTYSVAVNAADATLFDITFTADVDVSLAAAAAAGNGATATYTAATSTVTVVSS